MNSRIQDRLNRLAQPGLRPRMLSGGFGRNVGGAIALAGALFVLPACSNSTPTAETEEPSTYEEEVAEETETLEEAAENPDEYIGEIVTVSGEIQAIYDDSVFVLRDEEYFEPDADILIVNLNDTALQELSVGEYVQVSGEVSKFVLADIEEEYDVTWNDELVKEIEADFVEGPVIIATSVFEEDLPE